MGLLEAAKTAAAVSLEWIQAHNLHPWNEFVDVLAKRAVARKITAPMMHDNKCEEI